MTSEPRTIEIVGGGLAGLSLGLALRQARVPTTIFEAENYPRHRVCGEFMAGLKPDTLRRLGLGPYLADAVPNQSVAWFRQGELIRRHRLPAPALSLARHTLDARLANAFVDAGGTLKTHTRVDLSDTSREGRIFTCGRARARSDWLGLKLHLRHLPLVSELEFHLGHAAYVGLCRLPGDAVNVCGLFRRQSEATGRGAALFLSYLEASQLRALGERLVGAELDETSFSAVAGLAYGGSVAPAAADRIALGDAFATIPPYTGHGMALAFESAECALTPLVEWAHGESDWSRTTAAIAGMLRSRFARRLRLARLLHPFIFSTRRQRFFGWAQRTGLLPLRALTQAVHG